MKKLLSIVLCGILMFSFVACGNQAKETASTSDLSYITEKGEMKIGITLFAPMNYYQGNDLIGFETEFATIVCEELGVKPVFQEIDWNSKEIELNAKNIDCVWNGMTITDERSENMSITEPYMQNMQVLVTKAENVEKFKNDISSAKVVAEQGSAGEALANSNDFFKNTAFTPVDSQTKALLDVASGVSDIAVVDYVLSIGSIGEGTDFENLTIVDGVEFENENYGVAFRKGSDVTAKVNEIINKLAQNGTLLKIAEKYKLEDLLLKK